MLAIFSTLANTKKCVLGFGHYLQRKKKDSTEQKTMPGLFLKMAVIFKQIIHKHYEYAISTCVAVDKGVQSYSAQNTHTTCN